MRSAAGDRFTDRSSSWFSSSVFHHHHHHHMFDRLEHSMPISPEPSSAPLGEDTCALESLRHTVEQRTQMESQDVSSTRYQNPSAEIYRCNLCNFECTSNLVYSHHLNSHFDYKCPFCDYVSRTEGRLKRHVNDFHSEVPPETWTGTRVPQRTSDGNSMDSFQSNADGSPEGGAHNKSRTHKCKQCGYVAFNKEDFWEHSKAHIKTEKMLSCPKCPFVTEYKHHLEYHLRNHFGSKPFKCGKCNYSCVNKSMLNSHMKSHSNVYQYRCADCHYATKYCHSLKLHLRKYKHHPAVVLNPDGTPNPYPIIDIYGTRRGPRPKKNRSSEEPPSPVKAPAESPKNINPSTPVMFPAALPFIYPSLAFAQLGLPANASMQPFYPATFTSPAAAMLPWQAATAPFLPHQLSPSERRLNNQKDDAISANISSEQRSESDESKDHPLKSDKSDAHSRHDDDEDDQSVSSNSSETEPEHFGSEQSGSEEEDIEEEEEVVEDNKQPAPDAPLDLTIRTARFLKSIDSFYMFLSRLAPGEDQGKQPPSSMVEAR